MQLPALWLQLPHVQRQQAPRKQHSQQSCQSRLQSRFQPCRAWRLAKRSQQLLRQSSASQSWSSMSWILSCHICQRRAWCLQPLLNCSRAPGSVHSSVHRRQLLQLQLQWQACTRSQQVLFPRQRAWDWRLPSRSRHSSRLYRSSARHSRPGQRSLPAVLGWMCCPGGAAEICCFVGRVCCLFGPQSKT